MGNIGLNFGNRTGVRFQRHLRDQFNLRIFFIAETPFAVRHQADRVSTVAIGVRQNARTHITVQFKVVLLCLRDTAGSRVDEKSQRY